MITLSVYKTKVQLVDQLVVQLVDQLVDIIVE